MKLMPSLCLGSVELANMVRTTTYGTCAFFDGNCACPALDGDFVDVISDPAPWYDPTHPESANFYGFLPESITLSPPGSRTSTPAANEGSYLGPERLQGRVIEVVGWLVAQDYESMWYGEAWLTQALRGGLCTDCGGDVLQLLPFCRTDDGSPDYTGDFRTMVGVGLVDGPRWTEVSDDPSYMVVSGQFQFVASMPWLYHPPTRCLDAEPLLGEVNCSLTTPEWLEEGTFVIEIENTGTTDATDLTISGRISLDGSCPVVAPGDSVPPSFVYTIPTLAPEDRIVIDGTRRQALLYDASAKRASSALPYMEWEGPLVFPDVPPCTTICLSIEDPVSGAGDAVVTVDSYLRTL